MPALRELKMQAFIWEIDLEAQLLMFEGEIPIRAMALREKVEGLWGPSVAEEWQDFEFSTDVYKTSSFWHVVKTLKKKGIRG